MIPKIEDLPIIEKRIWKILLEEFNNRPRCLCNVIDDCEIYDYITIDQSDELEEFIMKLIPIMRQGSFGGYLFMYNTYVDSLENRRLLLEHLAEHGSIDEANIERIRNHNRIV